MKKINRRKFFRGLIYSLVSLEFGYVFFRLLKLNKPASAEAIYYDAGEVSFFEKGRVYPFGSARFFLYRMEDGGFIALSSRCTHLGCIVQFNASNDRFECPCHASAFEKNGRVITSPATRALDYYPIAFKDDKVLVDTGNPVRRSKFDQSQVMYV
ncbi:QcrA and Rieske domain-containing protein [Sunxiuqinia indica]|uniref:QcrA and Rieske domain-containing protein n=1 Tax=Sunxiuqinia indica TaxID=2692584 RepID=UPI00135A4134|nr:Rieske 2Fe-2S domain-containing protein [Sunxiuqinia indica]